MDAWLDRLPLWVIFLFFPILLLWAFWRSAGENAEARAKYGLHGEP